MCERIQTVRDLLEKLREAQSEPSGPATPWWFKDRPNTWFRGHARREWLLQPQVLRDSFTERARETNPHASDAAFSYEASLFNQFRRRGHHLLSASRSVTDAYFLAQHHGLPTRLLDWTANPLVGLFFAVAEHPDDDGSLVMMRARHEVSGEEERDVMYQEDPEVAAILEPIFARNFSPTTTPGLPLRIMPDAQSGRMLQQDSRFTLHQPGCRDLEAANLGSFISRVEVPSTAKRGILKELRLLGVHWATLFPDLPNLVRQIRHEAQA